MRVKGVGRPERHKRGSCIRAKDTGMRTFRLTYELSVEVGALYGVERRNMGAAECAG